MVNLPNKANVFVAKAGQAGFVVGGNDIIVIQNAAGTGAIQPAEQMQKCAFASAGFSDQSEALTATYGEVQAREDG